MADSVESEMPTTLKRACNRCRVRKIGCDKSYPCRNCRDAHEQCASTDHGQRPREARRRVLISTEYERKFDHVQDRIARIENHLKEIASSLHGSPGDIRTYSNQQLSPPSPIDETSSLVNHDRNPGTPFHGDSSLDAQATFASGLLQHALTQILPTDLRSNTESAMSTLQQIVKAQRSRSCLIANRFSNQRSLAPGGFRSLSMPPMQPVLQVLRGFKQKKPTILTLTCTFLDIEALTERCRQVYFATEEFSLATFIIVNCGLYYLFSEKALAQQPSAGNVECGRYRDLCGENLATVLGQLTAFLPAKMENIEALLLGANYAIEVSRPSLAWQINCMSAQMCQTLGYHRLSPLPVDRDNFYDHKLVLFWHTYILDRGLSLRLGRSPVIMDYDIATPSYLNEEDHDFQKQTLALWSHHSKIQGQVYEQLYSSRSFCLQSEERNRHVHSLAEEVQAIAHATVALQEEIERTGYHQELLIGAQNVSQIFFTSEHVSYCSTLTLIYRATLSLGEPSNTFKTLCINSAREAFRLHIKCMELAKRAEMQVAYLHWTILFAPFTPLIAILCHVIETSNADDLELLKRFVVSLEPVCKFSEAIEQFHRLSQALYDVAASYLEIKSCGSQNELPSSSQRDFDFYLSQLGLLSPTSEQVGLENPQVLSTNPAQSYADWFSKDWNIINLLEEDLSGLPF